jgi:hypothetical protein
VYLGYLRSLNAQGRRAKATDETASRDNDDLLGGVRLCQKAEQHMGEAHGGRIDPMSAG